MGYLLSAAFLFGDMDMFVAHALTLILHYVGSYLEFLDDEINLVMYISLDRIYYVHPRARYILYSHDSQA